MKRSITIVVVVIALIAAGFGFGWLYFRANPTAWDAFLSEMQGESTANAEPRVVSRPERSSSGLTASGNIEAEEVAVAAELGGRIIELFADEGDVVSSGDVLLSLDQDSLLAQRSAAEATIQEAIAGVATAQAQLAVALAGATEEDIAVVEAAVLAAEGALSAAEATLTQAEINAQIARTVEAADSSVAMAEAALAQAQGREAAARAGLAQAQAERARLLVGARPEEVALHQALVNQAQSQFLYQESIHFDFFIDPGIGGGPEERSRYQREAARGARDAAQAQLDLVTAGPTQEEVDAANAAVALAAAEVTIAQAGVTAAQAALSEAQAAPETNEDQVALADAGIAAAAAQVEVAAGRVAQAKAELDKLRAGATEQEIDVLEAQVAQAEAAVATAEAALSAMDIELSRATISAPAGGVVLQRLVHVGELAVPGAPLLTLADLDEVTLTVYVPEAELGRVALGQDVGVTVDAYDELFQGQVSHIASQAEFTPKNVQTQEERVHMVFAVEIRLPNADHRLKPGMPADASFAQ